MPTSPISPDVTAYADLRLYDRQPSDLVAAAIANAAVTFPGWTPREGNTEMMVIEGQALEVAEEVYAINRLPAAMTQVLLGLFGITQLPGAPPQAQVTFTVADTFGHTIPAGTNVRIPASVTGTVDVYFTTNAATVAPAGTATTNPVGITGAANTDAANALPVGLILDVLDPLYVVNSCQLSQSVTAGALPESGLAFLSRGVTALRSLNSTLSLAPQFTTFALTNGAFRAYTQDDYDATTPGTSGGVVSTAVVGQHGALLTSGAKAALAAAMNAQTQANLLVRVVDASINAVAVAATVMATAGQNATVVQAAVTSALQAYLSTDTWGWSATVRWLKLVNVVEVVAGVDYVISLGSASGLANNELSAADTGFETGVGTWTAATACTLAQSTTWFAAGAHSLAVTATGSGAQWGTAVTYPLPVGGAQIAGTVTFGPQAAPRSVNVGIVYGNGSVQSPTWTSAPILLSTTQPTVVSIPPETPPAGQTVAGLIVKCPASVNGDVIYLDSCGLSPANADIALAGFGPLASLAGTPVVTVRTP